MGVTTTGLLKEKESTANEYVIYMNQGVSIKANSEKEAIEKAKTEFLRMLQGTDTDFMEIDEVN
ncbi:hypothetical protein [Bacillus sp. NPDC094106]|uniref:hypothetical protein n=1 Tax=Bacillus sp. NPDC094106 TaxID=3363949 RepID=UPI0037F2DF67